MQRYNELKELESAMSQLLTNLQDQNSDPSDFDRLRERGSTPPPLFPAGQLVLALFADVAILCAGHSAAPPMPSGCFRVTDRLSPRTTQHLHLCEDV